MVNLFFFLLVFGTMAALIWSAVEFFRNQEDPLGDRLEELQSHAMVVPTRQPRRKGGGGFVNTLLYALSAAGLEGWLRETEKELHQAGMRSKRTVSFQQFVRRTGIEDIKSLAAMIVQSEKFGTSLAQALKVYADALRTRRRLRAEAAVGKAGIKMLFPIVIFILPVLFVITLVPGLISVLHDMELLGIGRR